MNILNIKNVLIIGDVTKKKPKMVSDEIKEFSKKFDDEYYTNDIIRRVKGHINGYKALNTTENFAAYVELPDDNGVVVVTNMHLSPYEMRINRELLSAIGSMAYASVQAVGLPKSYERLSDGLYAVTVLTFDGSTMVVYTDTLAA